VRYSDIIDWSSHHPLSRLSGLDLIRIDEVPFLTLTPLMKIYKNYQQTEWLKILAADHLEFSPKAPHAVDSRLWKIEINIILDGNGL